MDSVSIVSSAAVSCAVSPLGLFLLTVLLLALWPAGGRFRLSPRRWLLLTAALCFAFACTPWAGKNFLGVLERLSPETAPGAAEGARVVLILGGGAVAEGERYQPSLSSERRLRHGLNCLRGSQDVLMLSGIESPLLAKWLRERGFEAEILIERRSCNTGENIAASAALLARRFPIQAEMPEVLIVSDRFHMLRVMMWAERFMDAGKIRAAAAPSLLGMGRPMPGDWLPSLRGLERTSLAWREVLALVKDWLFLRWTEERRENGGD